MDWPLTGALAGIAILAAGASYGVVTLIQSNPVLSKKAVTSAQLVPRAELPVSLTPSLPREELAPTFRPLILSDSVEPFDISKSNLEANPGSNEIAPSAKARPPSVVRKAAPSRVASAPAATAVEPDISVAPKPNASALTSTPPNAALMSPAAQDKWRVVPTANATYFNLGGHINRMGIVDNLASSHLRDAFKAHRNFVRLPPDIRNHIITAENIDLTRVAPYRGLLGINDKKIEEEQAVRFERGVASR